MFAVSCVSVRNSCRPYQLTYFQTINPNFMQDNDNIENVLPSSEVKTATKTVRQVRLVKFKEFTYNGFSYENRFYSRATKYNLSGFAMVSSVFIESFSNTEMKCYYRAADVESVEMTGVMCDYDKECPGLLVEVALYRVHNAEPLFKTICPINEYGRLSLSLFKHTKKISAGRYFLVVNNAVSKGYNAIFKRSGIVLPFTLLEYGSNLTHPFFTQFSFAQESNVHVVGKRGTLLLNAQFENEVPAFEEFIATCYSSSSIMMAKDTKCLIGEDRKSLQISLDSDLIWVPEDYFLIIRHNNEAFIKVDFKLNKDEPCAFDFKRIKRQTPFYSLNKSLEHLEVAPELDRLPGLGSAKMTLIRLYEKMMLNMLRRINNLVPFENNRNFVIVGEDGITTRKLAMLIPRLLDVSQTEFKLQTVAELCECSNPFGMFSELDSVAEDCRDYDICITQCSGLLNGNGCQVVRKLEEALRSPRSTFFILIVSPSELKHLFSIYPTFAAHFIPENHIVMEKLTLGECINAVQKYLNEYGLRLSDAAQEKLCGCMEMAWKSGMLANWSEDAARDFVMQSIIPLMQERLIRLSLMNMDNLTDLLAVVEPEDIDHTRFVAKDNLFQESLDALNSMVGLQSIKKSLTATFNRIRFEQQRASLGLKNEMGKSHHLIFTGNPGTGKTTVAKMIGQLYRSLGILSKGDVIVTERSQLVGQYIGETERIMQSTLENARGNVLFIDEAYTLYAGGDERKDYGNRVIESLLTLLAEDEPDTVVILAGYAKEMNEMMNANAGLRDRFPHKINFEDYSAEELMQIGRNYLTRNDYILTAEADAALLAIVEKAVSHKDRYFSNARWMENVLKDELIPAMAKRVQALEEKQNVMSFRTIETEDVEVARINVMIADSTNRLRRKVGF